MEPTLYQRLGGASGIATLVDDVVDAHMRNPVISPRFTPYLEKPEHLAVVKGHLRNFFGAGSGGPETYDGRSMTQAHRGMNINDAEYMAAIDDIMSVLRKHKIDDQTQKDVLGIAYALRGEIIHV